MYCIGTSNGDFISKLVIMFNLNTRPIVKTLLNLFYYIGLGLSYRPIILFKLLVLGYSLIIIYLL